MHSSINNLLGQATESTTMRTIATTILFCSSILHGQEKVADPFAALQVDTQPAKPAAPREPQDLRPRATTLKLFGEPSLEGRKDAGHFPAIRVIWVRTFHPPISIRAYMTKDGPRLRVARTSGKGGYNWGILDFENDFPLKDETWTDLLKLLQAEGARQPFKNVKQEDRDLLSGFDGSTWKLEVSDKSGYSVDVAWTPTNVTDGKPEEKKRFEDRGIRLDNFVRLCEFLIQYAPIDPESIY